ncbi:hypothetical protein E2C01_077643 [Portunus trituberculatus]|uniref:Uncharacterized protein n=1 Tax=Portunus trituberculatus TaxID=210409 RepID=A0A5B7IS13_PORTR|nr:hypothetical protein [Portunus trituberculatus]
MFDRLVHLLLYWSTKVNNLKSLRRPLQSCLAQSCPIPSPSDCSPSAQPLPTHPSPYCSTFVPRLTPFLRLTHKGQRRYASLQWWNV